MNKHLPQDIVNRKKKGFGIPMARWLTGDLKPLLQELLNRDRIRKEGYFDPDFVQDLIDQHMAQKVDNRKALWTLMAFQMWKEKWM
jgi:asparagine synthase (glutamine-hydrolysing)